MSETTIAPTVEEAEELEATAEIAEEAAETAEAAEEEALEVLDELLIEEVSIDGMCGVY